MTNAPRARLLIVDDEAALRQALCDTLADEGYDTTGCDSAASALEALHGSSFDLLLADVSMPGMDGIELARRAMRIDPQLAAVIMTGEGSITTAVEALRTGVHDYILKPFKMGAILPALQRSLDMRRLRIENARLAQRLREHAAELEVTNQELDAFTRSASHDLRSPLAGVQSLLHLLLSQHGQQLPPQAARWLQKIDQEVKGTLRLMDDLLRLSRLGRQALELQDVDVAAMVAEVVDELRQRNPDRQVTVRVGPLYGTRADPGLLRQVFVNLLSNAFKFTRTRADATIEVGSRLESGEAVYFVRDNGVGFDMAQAGMLFHAFQRLHRPEEFEGTGVGLTIVQRIIQRHGGRLHAEAAPEQGARFEFSLPRNTAHGNEDPALPAA